MAHFARSASNSQIQTVRLVGDGKRRMPLGSRLYLAALVLGSGFLCVDVAYVNLDPGQQIAIALQFVTDCAADPLLQLCAAFDVITVHLYLHVIILRHRRPTAPVPVEISGSRSVPEKG